MVRRTLRSMAAVALVSTIVVIGASSPAAAVNTINVDTTLDVVAADGLTSLREAIDTANSDGDDTVINLGSSLIYQLTICEVKEPIDLGGGFFVSPPDDDSNADGDLDHTAVAEDLTINGNGSTIENTCLYDRVLHSFDPDGTVVLDGVTVTGGSEPPEAGAGMWIRGGLTLQNGVSVTGNTGEIAVEVGESVGGFAITPLTISSSSVSNNPDGGVRLREGVLNVSASDVNGNGDHGITASFSSAVITATNIVDNTRSGFNGVDAAVSISGSDVSDNGQYGVRTTGNAESGYDLVIDSSTVDDNGFTGVDCGYCTAVTITGSSVSGNGIANDFAAGGVGFVTNLEGPDVVIADTVITDNINNGSAGLGAHSGGGIRVMSESLGPGDVLPDVTLDNVTMTGNRSGILEDGGAIWAEKVNLDIIGSTLTENHAKPSDVLAGGTGGGISFQGPGTFSIAGSIIDDNEADSGGGGIEAFDATSLSIDDSSISGNITNSFGGGGARLFANGTMEITDTTIADNESGLGGGGLQVGDFNASPSTLVLDGVTVSGNAATGFGSPGGGIYATSDFDGILATNSTISGNSSGGGPGGGISAFGTTPVELDQVTIVLNDAGSETANLYHQTGPLDAFASAIALGQGAGDDCGTFSGAVVHQHSFSGDNSCGFGAAGGDPLLGPLADNGGPTLTHLPQPGSPLGGGVPLVDCAIPEDQRNEARPAGDACDIGAVEVEEGPAQLMAAMVVGSIPAPTRDVPVIERLESAGWIVDLVDDDGVGPASVAGADVVIISSSVVPAKVGGSLAAIPEPIFTWEPYLYGDLGLAGGRGETPGTQSTISVVGGEPLANGLSGNVTVLTSARRMSFGFVGPDADIAARAGGRPVIFGYDAGDGLVGGGNAAARRVGFFFDYPAPSSANANGWALFDAGIDWAVGGAPPPPPPPVMDIAFVSGSDPAPAPDQTVIDRLVDEGYSVTVIDDDVVTEGTVSSADLVIISSSVVPSTLGDTLAGVAAPLLAWEGYLFDDLGLATAGAETATSQQAIELVSGTALAGGLAGSPNVLFAPRKMSFGFVGPDAEVSARVDGRPVLFGYEAGDELVGGENAPARRVGFFFDYSAPNVASPTGWTLFETAVEWAMDGP